MATTSHVLTQEGLAQSVPPEAVRRAAVRATLAPSVHNTQPWRFVIGPSMLEVHADYARQLPVLDPTSRQLVISCGCAVFNARVSLAADGFVSSVRRYPDPYDHAVLARIAISPGGDRAVAALDPVIPLRRSNRRPFANEVVPEQVVATLVAAAQAEGVEAFPLASTDDRMVLAGLSQRAEAIENADPAYRAELRAWVSDDPGRRDGLTSAVIPLESRSATGGVPIRAFDTEGNGQLPSDAQSGKDQCLIVVGSRQDTPVGWLETGEGLERLWLEASRHGYAVSIFTQVIEIAATRAALRSELALDWYPDLIVRVGRAAATPASRRRRLVDVLREVPSSDSWQA
jgi:hypothetical protein